MTKRRHRVLRHLQDWWWLYGVGSTLCGVVVLWGGLPGRVAKAEQHLEKTQEEVDDLKGWAREIQGYTRAMNQQAVAPHTLPPVASVPLPPTVPLATDLLREVDRRGIAWCCNNHDQHCADGHVWYRCE